MDLLIEYVKSKKSNNSKEIWPKYEEKYKGENIGVFFSCIKNGHTNITEEKKQRLLALDPTLVIKEKEGKKKIKEVKNIKMMQQSNTEEQNKGRHIA